MNRNLTLLFFFIYINLTFSQTNVKRIDSLILLAKKVNDVDSSAKLLEMVKNESKIIGYNAGTASYMLTAAVDLYNKNKYNEALELTYQGENAVMQTEDPAKIAHLYALRGNCFNSLLFFDKSQECLRIALKYALQIKDNNTRYFSLGRTYRIMAVNFNNNPQKKSLDSVFVYHMKSYNMQQRITTKGIQQGGLIIQAAVIGQIYLERGHIDSAKYYFNNAIQLAEKNQLPKYAINALVGLGSISYQNNEIKAARDYYLKANSLVQKTKNAKDAKRVNLALGRIYDKLGSEQEALMYYNKYASVTDSLDQLEKASISVPLNYILMEREVLAAKEKQLKNVYLIFAICVALLSVFIVIILYKNISASRKNNRTLNRINKEIATQNEYLQNTLAALEQSHEDNNRVMQIITHDLRSPMAAIVGLSDFMIKEHNLAAEDLEVIELIHTSGIDSLNFINDILQKETEAAALKTEVVNLNQLINYCITQSRFKAKEKNQIISLESLDINVALNRDKIWRVISNLINNAIKFSREETTISVKLQIDKGLAVFSVADNGIGIPAQIKDKIFSRTEDSKRLGTNGEASFGVGLSICKQIIEAHGGKIWFKSQEGKGATFYFSLPIAK